MSSAPGDPSIPLVMDNTNTSFTDWSVTFFVKKALVLFEVSVYISASALTVNAVC